MENLLSTSWRRMWAGLGATGDGAAAYEELLARYSEPWRKYHTLQHLRECIATFKSAAHLAAHPAEVEAGLWFHDAVYELQRSDNEEQSAHLAQGRLSGVGVPSEVRARVAALVLATKHTASPQDPDEQLLVDVDLSILGAAEPRFAEYERQIREEYSFVPEAMFREKRRAILQSFIARPRIYSTPHFFGLLEQQARVNLTRTVGENAA
ncbi:HD domain-containing protein [Caenimonas soli]|uniref:HD domain-containing protein n=1 Tax=Caenimonas soli TaxID=2735555 RepID=UPI002E2845ED|nr:N-methyl-D-aspartate receptor NMDAR2C subunit [Caenimonas soli]